MIALFQCFTLLFYIPTDAYAYEQEKHLGVFVVLSVVIALMNIINSVLASQGLAYADNVNSLTDEMLKEFNKVVSIATRALDDNKELSKQVSYYKKQTEELNKLLSMRAKDN